MTFSFAWFRRRVIELVTALVLAVTVIFIAEKTQLAYRHSIPVTAWFQIGEIYVPDFEVGQDPEMVYDRDIIEWFVGFWIADVQRKLDDGMWSVACTGYGTSEYEPNEVIENDRVTLSWFLGRSCGLQPGTYRLKVTWSLSRPGWPPKTVVYVTREFTVT